MIEVKVDKVAKLKTSSKTDVPQKPSPTPRQELSVRSKKPREKKIG
jgi:hypothetical protein